MTDFSLTYPRRGRAAGARLDAADKYAAVGAPAPRQWTAAEPQRAAGHLAAAGEAARRGSPQLDSTRRIAATGEDARISA